jgi:hypothetical protein
VDVSSIPRSSKAFDLHFLASGSATLFSSCFYFLTFSSIHITFFLSNKQKHRWHRKGINQEGRNLVLLGLEEGSLLEDLVELLRDDLADLGELLVNEGLLLLVSAGPGKGDDEGYNKKKVRKQ